MTDDIRERLHDLAEEMPPLHAPADLAGKVRRRELRTIVGTCAALLILVLGVGVAIRSWGQSSQTPANHPTYRFPFAGSPTPATQVRLEAPEGLTVDPAGGLFISEWDGNKVNFLTPQGSLGTIAGTGAPGYSGDGAPATLAQIDAPMAMALEPDGSMLFVDNHNNCIRRIDPSGTITTVAGLCGQHGYSGDGGQALEAKMSRPIGLVIDPNGGFYFSDNDHGLVRHVDAAGIITTVAGAGDVSPLDVGPDGAPASSLNLGRTSYLLLDPHGNLYVTDLRLDIVVKIDPAGTGTVFAGTGKAGYSGDGGPATKARLNFPAGLAMDPRGDLYVADSLNNVIRVIRPNGIIRTFAGTGVSGSFGDGRTAIHARLDAPSGLAFGGGMLFIADQQNELVRRVDARGIITTIAGGG
jgi:sugar lactone lactonase YvrE